VYCQLDTLRRCLPTVIRHALDELPESLDETYERTLLGIEKEKREFAHRLFQSITVAVRPLRMDELAEILAIHFDTGLPRYQAGWRLEDAQEAVLSTCSSLITIVNIDGSPIIQFSHFSVKEFLTSDRLAKSTEDLSCYHILPHSAHTILAQASLSVLLHLGDRVDKNSIKKFPFAQYAARHWVDHGRFENVSSSIQDAMERLFDLDEPSFATWIWIYDIDYPFREPMFEDHPTRPEALPLYYASLCGFRNVVEHLITKHPDDIDARGGNHGSAVNAALKKRNIEIALLLLERGADVNIMDSSLTPPLCVASEAGRRDIVEVLLEHHADVDLARRQTHATPLNFAALEGELEIVRALLHHGATVDCPDLNGWTPLMSGSRYGHSDTVQLLIQRGATVDYPDYRGWTPLMVASQHGHLDIARLLVQSGAAVDSPNYQDWTPLMSASRYGHLDIARLLIQSGAAVDSPNNRGWTPLTLASGSGHLDIVQFLIQHGATVDSYNHKGETALILASRHGYFHIAQDLLDRGAAINAQNNDLETPLHLASAVGNLNIVELLLERHADIDKPNKDQQTPLDRATANKWLEVARLLVKSGSNPNSQDSHGSTPLHTAAHNGDLDIVKLLLDSGADVNLRNGSYRIPLDVASASGNPEVAKYLAKHMGVMDPFDAIDVIPSDKTQTELGPNSTLASVGVARHTNILSGLGEKSLHDASAEGNVQVVQSLLDQGADVNGRDPRYRTALDMASRNGELEVAALLLKYGADVNCQGKVGWTPLLVASRDGDRKIAELLLDHGADVNIKQQNLQTPLHIASWNGNLEVVRLLLERGADIHARDMDGRTPTGLALRRGERDIIRLLSAATGVEA